MLPASSLRASMGAAGFEKAVLSRFRVALDGSAVADSVTHVVRRPLVLGCALHPLRSLSVIVAAVNGSAESKRRPWLCSCQQSDRRAGRGQSAAGRAQWQRGSVVRSEQARCNQDGAIKHTLLSLLCTTGTQGTRQESTQRREHSEAPRGANRKQAHAHGRLR